MFACGAGSLEQQGPEAPFQASCFPTVFVDDMLQPERCGYTGMDGGRGLLLVQSADEVAL